MCLVGLAAKLQLLRDRMTNRIDWIAIDRDEIRSMESRSS